jgi:two-component sensor histidine kinase
LLQAQQQEINLINQNLELTVAQKDSLLKEKDALLIEKDWLLKEVHHRVKNNLHTVMCLLESQELYLENAALAAIEISQRRIYAMSLIHQKLYQSEDIEWVDMTLYIKEFVQYLADSFGAPANISIRSVVEPTNLGISQAIPLGLILNEAVTNAFKYAFPDNKTGEIFVGLTKTGNNTELVIADDGIGIQCRADESEPPNSLGIELMKGLTNDLKGNINFDTDSGTRITIIFALDPLNGVRKTGFNSKHLSTAYDS